MSVLAPRSVSQCPPSLTFSGEKAGDQFGESVSGAGDVNGDGYVDLIVGSRFNSLTHSLAGRAYVYSGQNGTVLYVFGAEADFDGFGSSVSGAGDVDNDGYGDVVVGAAGNDAGGNAAGRAYVYSGKSGSLLYTLTGEGAGDQFGVSVSGAGDVNLDGYDDVIVGARFGMIGGGRAGLTYVYSGRDGALLYKFVGEAVGDNFGGCVASAGDVDKDGYADLIVGAVGSDSGGVDAGRVYVYSGKNGALLNVFTGESSFGAFGTSVASAGDVDNDGNSDLIVGAPRNAPSGTDSGEAHVYSGRTGELLYVFGGESAADLFGQSVSGAGDVDNDGHADLIISATSAGNGGLVYVYSGATGSLLYIIPRVTGAGFFGVSVSGVGDIDSDGFDDVIVGASLTGGSDAGAAFVYLLGDTDGDTIDNTCDNCPNVLNPDQIDTNGNGVGDVCDCCIIPGDANNDGIFNIADVTFGIARIFTGGPAPTCQDAADADGDNAFNIADVTYGIARIFGGGPAPICGTSGF